MSSITIPSCTVLPMSDLTLNPPGTTTLFPFLSSASIVISCFSVSAVTSTFPFGPFGNPWVCASMLLY